MMGSPRQQIKNSSSLPTLVAPHHIQLCRFSIYSCGAIKSTAVEQTVRRVIYRMIMRKDQSSQANHLARKQSQSLCLLFRPNTLFTPVLYSMFMNCIHSVQVVIGNKPLSCTKLFTNDFRGKETIDYQLNQNIHDINIVYTKNNGVTTIKTMCIHKIDI